MRSEIMRFPERRFSVVILSNAGDVYPEALAHQVAEVFLGGLMEPRIAAAEEAKPRDTENHPANWPPLTAKELTDREGEFYSDELHVLYTVVEKEGSLVVRYPRGELPLERGDDPDTFSAAFPIGLLHYICSPRGGCEGFRVNDGRS
jgi:hypothetical protein